MNKKIICAFAFLFLVNFISAAGAYASYYYDPYYGAELYLSLKDEKPACYGWSSCQNYRNYFYNYKPYPYGNEDFWKYYNTRRAVAFLDNSFHDRYYLAAGEKSADVFCKNCKIDNSASGFGNRPAYFYQDNGRSNYKSGSYYDPTFDKKLGHYNWRY